MNSIPLGFRAAGLPRHDRPRPSRHGPAIFYSDATAAGHLSVSLTPNLLITFWVAGFIGVMLAHAESTAYSIAIDTNVLRDIRRGDSFTFQIHPGLPPRTFKLVADPETDTIEKIEVYLPNTQQPEQILKAKQGEPPYRESDYFKAVDIDFDGYQDIGLLKWWGATGNEGWQFWRFDPDSGKFVEDPEISALGRPEFDPKTRTVRAFSKGVWCQYTTTTYAYLSGKLRAIEEKRCLPPSEKSIDAPCDCQTKHF